MPTRKHALDAATLRRLSVLADADPRTVRKVLDGGRVGGMVGQRIVRVLSEHGLLDAQAARLEPAR